MKLFKKIFWGLMWGVIIGGVICLIVLLSPWLEGTFGMICGLITCNFDMCEAGCNTCNEGNSLSHAFDYGSTMLFSLLICTSIGIVWGVAITTQDIMDKKIAKEKKFKAEEKARQQRQLQDINKKVSNLEKNIHGVLVESKRWNSSITYMYDGKQIESYNCLRECKAKKVEAEDLYSKLMKN